ncbi:MAG: radical SAM protein [Oscillospiraceae bacterium]|nr:radical SAM protein [Oscillospiraceae bacterium]
MKNIYGMTFDELENYFALQGESKAASKAKLTYNYLYKNNPHDYSKRISAMLERDFSFAQIEVQRREVSPTAEKFLFGLQNGNSVEAVLMRQSYGNALCISTQVGCGMNCAFCKSGNTKHNKKVRDLLPHEMTLQIIAAEKILAEKIPRVTLMGIGEPLDNYENVKNFLEVITHRHGRDTPARFVTVSTCGLVPGIKRLMADAIPCNLAVSLNATEDSTRSRLMPVNNAYPIAELLQTVREYSAVKSKKTTLEYVMLGGINDSDDDAHRLVTLTGGINCYINLIPYNNTDLGFTRSPPERLKSFYDILIQGGARAVVRKEFGGEIRAACGQLTNN